jgi:oligopeptide transport system permease protein
VYFLKRIAFIAPLLLVISFLAFALVRVAPGGPFDRERKAANEEIERRVRAKYHLDEPVWRQYLRFLGGLARGDLGPSLKYRNHSVNDIVAQALPVSLILGGLAFVVALGVGVPLGVITACRRHNWIGHTGNFLMMLAVCVPALLLGPALILLFAIHWQWFPVGGWESPWHLVLPVVTLGVFFSGRIARLMREGMLATLDSPFIQTARAKGLSEIATVWKHAFPIAVLPVVSYSGPLLADLLTGSFVVENVFQLPGIGVFMVNSSLNRDYPMIVGLVLLYAVLLLLLNVAVDFVYALLDPRVRYE